MNVGWADADTDSPVLLVEDQRHVRVITINRPRVLNAVNLAVSFALGDAVEEAHHDPNIRVVVLTGSGDRAFCAGADLKAAANGEKYVSDDPQRESWGFAGYVAHGIDKPTIAAVNGLALGGGAEIAMASDIVVATEGAVFGLPEVSRGILASGGGAFRIVNQVPPKVAMEMLLTGAPITAERAYELGLVNHVVPVGEALPVALRLADVIASHAPLAVQASKRIALGVRGRERMNEVTSWDLSNLEWGSIVKSNDAQEGPRAFAEKRPPVWTAT